MKQLIIGILLFTGSFATTQSQAQNWDVNFVKSVNPQNPNSGVFKTWSTSAYVVGAAAPVTTFVVGLAKHDKKIQQNAYELAGSIVIASVVTKGLKVAIDRERPYQKYSGIYPHKIDDGESFPSGHATVAFATATTLSLQYKKWYIVVPAYVWAAGVGYSRLYLGEHYTTDVLAGAVVGTGSAFLSHWLTKKLFKEKPALTTYE